MSTPTEVQAADVRAPSGSAAPTDDDLLAGTGTTEDTNATGLTIGEQATLIVGSEAIRIDWGSATAPTVGLTDLVLGPYARYDWVVGASDAFVSVQAADAASAYQAWVWTSSGERKA